MNVFHLSQLYVQFSFNVSHHALYPFPHKRSSWVIQVFLNIFVTASLSYTNVKYRMCTYMLLYCESHWSTIVVLLLNIHDSSHGTKAKTVLPHSSSVFPFSWSLCLSMCLFSLQHMAAPSHSKGRRGGRESKYFSPSHTYCIPVPICVR